MARKRYLLTPPLILRICQCHPDVYQEVTATLAAEREQIAENHVASVPHP